MKAIISVVGKDCVGILAGVASQCAECSVNVVDVSQSVLQDMFCMIMVCDISKMTIGFGDFADRLSKYGQERGLCIHTMHEDIFNSMHRI